jgi:hypothetical protein
LPVVTSTIQPFGAELLDATIELCPAIQGRFPKICEGRVVGAFCGTLRAFKKQSKNAAVVRIGET